MKRRPNRLDALSDAELELAVIEAAMDLSKRIDLVRKRAERLSKLSADDGLQRLAGASDRKQALRRLDNAKACLAVAADHLQQLLKDS